MKKTLSTVVMELHERIHELESENIILRIEIKDLKASLTSQFHSPTIPLATT